MSGMKGVTWARGPREELRPWLEAHGMDLGQTRSVTLFEDGSVDVVEYVLDARGKRYPTNPIPVSTGRHPRALATQATSIRADEMGAPFPYDSTSP